MANHVQKQIRLCITGLTPQILTETLYAITQVQRERIDEIRVITMLNGRDRILQTLLDPHQGKFFEFCRDYGINPASIKFDETTITLLRTPDGIMLRDIHSIKENEYVANQIVEIVRELTKDANTYIHASAAGGRKTMGLHLLNAMQLYGRPQDKLSHVLVSEELETHPDFFYIPPVPRELPTRYGQPISTATAEICLVEIPFRPEMQNDLRKKVKQSINYKVSRLERYFRDPVVGDGIMHPDLSSEACRNIRIALRFLDYKVGENDQYDEELEKAVLAFQRNNNHTSLDGYVGPGTRRLLTQKLMEKSGERPFKIMKYSGEEPFPRVFLSYAHEDIMLAQRLYNDLQESGVNIWFDRESLFPGQKWKEAITESIRGSRYFLALLSTNSVNKKGYVQKEMKDAIEVLDEHPQSSMFLIPARLDACSPSDLRLRDLHWVDMFPNWEEGLAQILKTLALQT